ncbi:MAG: class I SAM-dependent methyltransferase [Legionella sp.]|uniref:class I SAM-dependent methyltransferase n=1 Tax=Legionella sp. TaxID=459 RepID=UPI0028418561|nr:class I SAM-dependent methyltransferase [Legionella sp.]
MKLNILHKDSYSQLTDYYANLTEPMAILRRQVLETALCGQLPETAVHVLGSHAATETAIPKLPAHASILDVGCANGDNLVIMQQLGFEQLSGIDIAPEMVEAANLRTQQPVHCVDLFDYQEGNVDVVFAQAMVHLFPKQELFTVLRRLMSLSQQRVYFSTTVHEQPSEGLEPKFQVVRYRSRYTEDELLTAIGGAVDSDQSTRWQAYYFFLTDCLGKRWMNVVLDKVVSLSSSGS